MRRRLIESILRIRTQRRQLGPMHALRASAAAGYVAVALLFASAGAISAADEPEPVPAQVRALHQLADLDSNLRSFCATLIETAQLTLQTPGHPMVAELDAAGRERWLASITHACSLDLAREIHLRAFAVGYDPEAARAVTAWYTSDVGERLLALETAAAETNWDAEVSPFIDQITREPVPVERVKLFERIDTALETTEEAALLQTGIQEILVSSAQSLLPESSRTPAPLLEQQLAALRAHYAAQLKGQQSVVFMFVYRKATDEDLAAFADFAESPAAHWLHVHHRMAMLQLIAELREDIVAELGELAEAKPVVR